MQEIQPGKGAEFVSLKAGLPEAVRTPDILKELVLPVDKVRISRKALPGADDFGVSSGVWQKATQDPELKKNLQSLNPEVIQGYKNTGRDYKVPVNQALRTKFGIFPFSIMGRDAFIRGSAFGTNVFDYAQNNPEVIFGEAEKQFFHRSLTADEKQAMMRADQLFKEMTPKQRESLVVLLEADLAASHKR